MEQKVLKLLSGGAAQGVVGALAGPFRAESGYEIRGEFGAVGAMKEKLLAGAPADLVILTRALVDELARAGNVLDGSRADLGAVHTGIAVKRGDPLADISNADALRELLRAAHGIYFPDPERATAGIHFVRVLDALGIRAEVAQRLRPYPSGTVAMREMASAGGAGLVGCTQITEIRGTDGVALVGPLPPPFDLATVYTAGVCAGTSQPEAAKRFVSLLVGAASRALRQRAGFEL